MPDEPREAINARLIDPLSEITRRERRYLLGVAFVSIIVARAGLVPTEISNLGITFSEVDRSIILKAAATAISYFMLAFVLYGIQDFFAWRAACYQAAGGRGSENPHDIFDSGFAQFGHAWADVSRQQGLAVRGSIIRAVFEFALPPGTGLYAIYVLWRAW